MTHLLPQESVLSYVLADGAGVTLLSILCVVLILKWLIKEKKNFPPGPYGLPVVGYLPFLGEEPFRTLTALSDKYGKIFSVRFGRRSVVVVADNDSFKEAYSKTELLDRPPGLFDFLPGGGGFTDSNGKLWVEQRRFTMKSVRNLGLGKGPWETVITEEVSEFVKLLRRYDGKAVDVTPDLTSSVSRNVVSLLLAKQIEEGSATSALINDFVDKSMKYISYGLFWMNLPGILDILVKLNVAGLRKCYNTMVDFNNFMRSEIVERETASSVYDSGDFIGSYLEEMKKNELEEVKDTTFSEVNLMGNMKAMFLGGAETTKTSLQWLFVAMAMHPDIQEKIYNELETVLGEQEVAHWENRSKLPLTYASIMEGQRWKTLSPLSVMRYTSEDTKICGYDIPKGTAVVGLLWALHNDAKFWKNPERFDPTRFLKSDGTINWKPESYAPFSIGRRNCPGETVALMALLIYLSAIVRNFKIEPANPNEEFRVGAVSGITYQPTEHKLRFVPRKR